MKKNIYLLIAISVLLLTGCGTKDTMVNFIPTPIPEVEESVDDGSEATDDNAAEEGEAQATPVPDEIHVGQTKTMYVKMDEYGAFLNVRATPSKDGEKVGFLVHAEKVDVVEIKDGWASIKADNTICYVSADFLVEERPTYIPAPTATPVPENTPTPIDTPTPTPNPEELPPEI